MSRIRLLHLPLALLAAAVLATAASSGPSSGLYGTVLAGPTRPVCVKGEPCYKPVRVTLVFSRLATAKETARVRSTAAGRYRLGLPAGYYAVRTVERIGLDRSVSPRRVHVRAGHLDRIIFRIDTGIR